VALGAGGDFAARNHGVSAFRIERKDTVSHGRLGGEDVAQFDVFGCEESGDCVIRRRGSTIEVEVCVRGVPAVSRHIDETLERDFVFRGLSRRDCGEACRGVVIVASRNLDARWSGRQLDLEAAGGVKERAVVAERSGS
jgi:hypothetical protein